MSRRIRTGSLGCATAVAVLGPLLVVSAPTAQETSVAPTVATTGPSDAAERSELDLDRRRTVTLVTGHRVTLSPRAGRPPLVTVEGENRAAGMRIRRDGEVIEVVPHEVAELVPEVLDPRLFDVAGLVSMGYDDARRDDLPLVVRRAPGVRILGSTTPFDKRATLTSLRADAVRLPKDLAPELGADLRGLARPGAPATRTTAAVLGGVEKIWLDARVAALGGRVDRSATTPQQTVESAGPAAAAAYAGYLTQIGAPAAWDAGLIGDGVEVAVLDTGVDTGHPALDELTVTSRNFTDSPSAGDVQGHGTHVASLIAGDGDGSDGALRGVAYGADLLNAKVLGDDGFGQESSIIAGMEWAAAQGADVVNMSLAGPAGDTDDLMTRALDRLSAETDTLFVVAAGNAGGFGPDPESIGSPGTAAAALTVASVDPGDIQSLFSSEGPVRGSYRAKPDMSAPGQNIPGARAGARAGDEDLYVAMGGTSQATPQVAAAAAILLQQHPNWDGERLKQVLTSTAQPLVHPTTSTTGSGRLAVERAIQPAATVSPGIADFGLLEFGQDEPRTREVTITNPGATPLELDVTVDLVNEQEVPAPEGILSTDVDSVVVPPRSSETVTVTFDPIPGYDNVYWQGRVRFSQGDVPLLDVPVSAYDELEQYTLDLTVIDRNGDPVDDLVVPLQNLITGYYLVARVDDGRATELVPRGVYSAIARIETPATGSSPRSLTIAGDTEFDVSQDVAVTIDARDARPVRAPRVQGHPTEASAFSMTWESTTDDGAGHGDLVSLPVSEIAAGGLFVGETEAATIGSSATSVRWQLMSTDKRGRAPDTFEIHWRRPRFPAQVSPDLSRHDVRRMARLTSHFHRIGASSDHVVGLTSLNGLAAIIHRRPLRFPQRVVSLVTASPRARWSQTYSLPADSWNEAAQPYWTSFAQGEKSTVHFGRALHGSMVEIGHGEFGNIYAMAGVDDGEADAYLPQASVRSSMMRLYRNGKPVGTTSDVSGYFKVPDDRADYRLVHNLTLDRDAIPVTSRTSWTFPSQAPRLGAGGYVPPLLTVDYGPRIDALTAPKPRRKLRFDTRFGQQVFSTESQRIVHMRLRWSIDNGRRWRDASVRRTGPKAFAVTIPGPALRSGTQLSLWLRASDSDSNSIDQKLLRVLTVP